MKIQDLFTFQGRVSRAMYALTGIIGTLIKHNIDRVLAMQMYRQKWGLTNYLIPLAVLNRPNALTANEKRFLLTMALVGVPFVDVMNTMLDESLPLTVGEFEEWGNPKEKPAFDYMMSYSPYDNIQTKTYPNMLVKTSFNDSQVMYWESAKYVAKMRAIRTDHNLLLLKTNMDPAGHGGASGRYDRLKEAAFDYAFLLTQMGIQN